MGFRLKPLRAVIVEDEPHAARRLNTILGSIPDVQVVGTAVDGASAIDLIASTRPDLVFLDINIPGLTGVDVARHALRGGGYVPAVVFVTAYDTFAIEAFELRATDYLLKPVELGRVAAAVAKARDEVSSQSMATRLTELEAMVETLNAGDSPAPRTELQIIWVSSRQELVRVPVDTIRVLRAERDYVRLITAAGEYLHRETLHGMLDRLGSRRFLRVHRSAAVNRACVSRIARSRTGRLQLVVGEADVVPVGRNYADAVRGLTACGPL